jgi:glycine/D-amino acid oxidase-like deaminating enzyme
MNTVDHNGIVGPHTEVDNLYLMNGFSGHGMQQAPAVGRALAERLLYGEFRSLDLRPLAYDRIEAGRPLTELAIIG